MEKWFSRALTGWYKVNKRDLPWRHETDPYRIWLSEVILQQTRVEQGLSYYLRFVEAFPTVQHLAAAPEDEVLKLWQGLGYYSRARNLLAAARSVVSEHAGAFPQSFDGLRKLKGIGDYTAAAVASFSFNLPYAVVDGNVYRVLSRVFGIASPIDSQQGKKEFAALAQELLDKTQPALHNQAIMEFGSQHCRPLQPACDACPLSARCVARKNEATAQFPVKSKKTKVRSRHFHYLLLLDKKNRLLLNRRNAADIWQGLYEFRLIETEGPLAPMQLVESDLVRSACTATYSLRHVSGEYRHILTHQRLFARFYVLRVDTLHGKDAVLSPPAGLHRFAFPRLIEKFLEDCDLKEII